MLLVGCQAIEAIAVTTLLSTVLSGAITRELILGVAFIMGVARAFEVTVMQIIVPALVPLRLVPRAVAGSATANQTATIAGPALGGFLYAAGPAIVYGTCLALVVRARHRQGHVRGGRDVRTCHHRLRAVSLFYRRDCGADRARRLRHGERGTAHDIGSTRHARCGARPRHRGQRLVHRGVES